MKKIILVCCLFVAVTSCVSNRKYMMAENGRLAALSRERVLNKNLAKEKEVNTELRERIAALLNDTTRMGEAIREYRRSLYSNMSEQEKLSQLLQEKMD